MPEFELQEGDHEFENFVMDWNGYHEFERFVEDPLTEGR